MMNDVWKGCIVILFFIAFSIPSFAATTITINNPTNGASRPYGTINLNYSITNTTVLDATWYVIDTYQSAVTRFNPGSAYMWSFDEGTGLNAFENNSNILYNFTLNDTLAWTASGYTGAAFNASGRFEADANGSFMNNTLNSPENGTLEFYVRSDRILDVTNTEVDYILDVVTSGSESSFRWNGGKFRWNHWGTSVDTTTGSLAAGTWYKIALSWGKRGMFIWINDSINVTNAGTKDMLSNSATIFVLGNQYTGTGSTYFNGSIDNLRYYNYQVMYNETSLQYNEINTTFTKNELDTFPVRIYANDTTGSLAMSEVNVTTWAMYQFNVSRSQDGSPATNFTIEFANTINKTANGTKLYVNATDLASIRLPLFQNITVGAIASFGGGLFNRTLNNETLVWNETFSISQRRINITFRDEDSLAYLQNLSVNIENSSYSASYTGINNNTAIDFNYSGTFTVQVHYLPKDGYRDYILSISPFDSSDIFITAWFPDSGNVYTFSILNAGSPLSGDLVTVYRYINGSYAIVAQGLTQVDGTTNILAKASVPHKISSTKTGCLLSGGVSQPFDYVFSPTQYATPISISMNCAGSGNLSAEFPTDPVTVTWNPTTTATKIGVSVSVSDASLLASYMYMNVTRSNYTNITYVTFQNVSTYQYIFTVDNLIKNNLYRIEICVNRVNVTRCVSHNYINATFVGIGNWSASQFAEAADISPQFMSIVFLFVLLIVTAALYPFLGTNTLGVFVIITALGVLFGFMNWGIGALMGLVATGLFMIGSR